MTAHLCHRTYREPKLNLLKKTVLAVAVSAIASSAFAGGFDGPFVQASLGWAKSETKVEDLKWNDSTLVGKLAAGYGHSFGAFNLSANVFYIIGDLKSGDKTFVANNGGAGKITAKGTNTYGVSVEPGWNVSDSTLAYAKFSYVHTKGKISEVNTSGGITTSDSMSQDFNGFGYGIGVKHKFSQNLYGLAEIEQIDFESKNDFKPNTLGAYIGIGYKF